MAHINIEFTLFSAFYSPLISLMSGGFLQAEGLEADWTVSIAVVDDQFRAHCVGAARPPNLHHGTVDLGRYT
jgi:hypothetical protein